MSCSRVRQVVSAVEVATEVEQVVKADVVETQPEASC